MSTHVVTIKIGGALAKNVRLILELAQDMKELEGSNMFIIVHGGGEEVSELTRRFGMEPVFRDGIRITSVEEMAFVDKVLCGKVNKRLVRLFQKSGFDAVGLSGSDGRLFLGRSIGSEENPTHTGKITAVNPRLVRVLLEENYLPVIASTSMDNEAAPLNINADEVAFKLSTVLKTDVIVFLSDIPGVLRSGKVSALLTSEEIRASVADGTITGGMIPKVNAALDSLTRGVGKIIIGECNGSGSLKDLINGKTGTQIVM
ncbi:MAG: acetylglutamate kinase [Spirochaetales bacterium]|nr:acetylglutamate kinase [Spirochaetales bacterium]